MDGTEQALELSLTEGGEENQRSKYEELVMCEGSQDEGVIHIQVAALPYQDPVEFNTAEARAFAERILRAVEHVEAGWMGGKGGA